MSAKFFTAFCTMNDKDLRANPFYHGCLVCMKAECNEAGVLTSPLQVIDAYGFYSHPLPSKKPLLDGILTFFSQYVLSIRLRGSYGEWRREDIHYLSYGRGLAGRIFEMSESQVNGIIDNVNVKINQQNDLFHCTSDLQEREDKYQATINNRIVDLVNNYGMEMESARKKAREETLPEFKFGFYGDGYNCKVAALDSIESSFDKMTPELKSRIDSLRQNSAFPRYTKDVDNIIIHADTDQWETRGKNEKYAYCDWKKLNNDHASLYVVDFQGKYVAMNGEMKQLFCLSDESKKVVDELKSISRVCEINLNSPDPSFKQWYQEICQLMKGFAMCKNDNDQQIQIHHAENYLQSLVSNNENCDKLDASAPVNLHAWLDNVLDNYNGMHQLLNLRMR